MHQQPVVAEFGASNGATINNSNNDNNPPPPPPPPPHRRPRVREVSSRFMSPVGLSASSLSSSPLPKRSASVQRQRRHLDMDPLPDENNRPMESSATTQRKNQRSLKKLFREQPLRPDTPMLPSSSRLRLMQQRSSCSSNNMSAAARLLQSSGLSESNSCLRSSLPEAELVSSRLLTDKNRLPPSADHPKLSSSASSSALVSPCSRSLDLPLPLSSGGGGDVKTAAATAKPPRSIEVSSKLLIDFSRKGGSRTHNQNKVGSDDAHSLRLLHNHYLQWRFANAKAEASFGAQTAESQRTLCSLGERMSELRESVKRKRMELGLLQRRKTLWSILESQMACLEDWSSLEEEYSASLSEATQALWNSSVQLPIGANVRADVREVGEALNSAVMLMEAISSHVRRFIPKAGEIEMLISEVAKISGAERGVIQECGDLLSKAYRSQVEECSLRGHLIQQQLHQRRSTSTQHHHLLAA